MNAQERMKRGKQMKFKRMIGIILSSAMAAVLVTGSYATEIIAESDEFNEEGNIEMVSHTNADGEEEYALLLHGHSIFIDTSRVDDTYTKIYDDKNHNGLLDSSDPEIDIKSLGEEVGIDIDFYPNNGYDCTNVVIYGVGGFNDDYYTEHTGNVMITYKGGAIKGIVGSTGGCEQTGDFIFNTMGSDTGEVEFIEGAGAGTWNGNITMVIYGETPFHEVYGGSKNAETIVNGNVMIRSHETFTIAGVFGDSAYSPTSGGVYAGGEGTTINGDFEFWIQPNQEYTIYDLDSSKATITGEVKYTLSASHFYGDVRTNDKADATIKAGGISTCDENSVIYLNKDVVIDPSDTVIEYSRYGINIEPEIKALGTVIVKPTDESIVLTNADSYKGVNLLKNTGYVLNDQNEIVIGRANKDVMMITLETGTSQMLEPQLEIKGDAVKLPKPTRSGYEFAGWSDGTTTYAPGSDYTVPEADVILTAVWKSVSSGSSSSPTSSNGFVNKKGETYFYEKGKPVQNGFVVVNDKDKLVETIKPDNMQELSDSDYKAYYAKPDGSVAKAEWIVLDKNGKLIDTLPLGEFKKQYGNEYKVYLADANGKLIRSWKDTENNWYYFNADFSAKYEYWQAHYEDWYYFDNYSYLKNTWHATDNGRWYYFDAEGKMVRNQWVDGCWINELGIYWSPIYSDPEFIANYK